MNSWVYPISKEDYTVETIDGKMVYLNAESFKECLKDNTFEDGVWWNIKKNYKNIKIGDNIYIYATKKNKIFGILGYAIIENINTENKKIFLKFDFLKSKKIMKKPIPLDFSICSIPYEPVYKVSSECEKYIKEEIQKLEL